MTSLPMRSSGSQGACLKSDNHTSSLPPVAELASREVVKGDAEAGVTIAALLGRAVGRVRAWESSTALFLVAWFYFCCRNYY